MAGVTPNYASPLFFGFPSGSAQEECGHREAGMCLMVNEQQMYILI